MSESFQCHQTSRPHCNTYAAVSYRARNKLESGDGLSFGEFSYPVLQAYDWWNMYSTFQLNGVQLQIGGSDQYGNIMAGVEAVNYIRKNHYAPEVRQEKDEFLKKPMGFTVPLLTTSSGEKFGKSAGNAIWLDRDMTSPFDLYQVRPSRSYSTFPDPNHTRSSFSGLRMRTLVAISCCSALSRCQALMRSWSNTTRIRRNGLRNAD